MCLWLIIRWIVKLVVIGYLLIGVVVTLLHGMKEGRAYGRGTLYAIWHAVFGETVAMYRSYRDPGVIGSIWGVVKTVFGLLLVAASWPLVFHRAQYSYAPYPPSV